MSSVASLIEYLPSPKYEDERLLSTDRSILSTRQVEIIPRESSSFGRQKNSAVGADAVLTRQITFNVSDPRHYLDWENTYFQAELNAVVADTNDSDLYGFLDNGGIHSLIKTVIVRHGSAEVHRIENYNKLYNILNLSMHDRDYRNRILADSADSYEDQYMDNGDFKGYQLTYTQATATYTASTAVLDFVAGDAENELQVGDVLLVSGEIGAAGANGNISRICHVVSITDANSVVVDGMGRNSAGNQDDIQATYMRNIQLLKRGGQSARRSFINGSVYDDANAKKVCFQIPFGLFMVDRYFPLPFLNQNLEITLELEEPELGFVLPLQDSGDAGPFDQSSALNKLGYKITRARLNANLIEPSADVFDAHRQLWSDTGLVYRTRTFRTYQNQIQAGETVANFSFQANIKSLHGAFAVMMNQADQNSGNNATQNAYCQSDFLRNSLRDYRFRIGGLQFPDYGPVDTSLVSGGECWKMLQKTLGVMGNKVHGCSIEPWEWQSDASKRFIMAMNFAKENNVYNDGADVSNNYLEMEVNFKNGLTSSQNVYAFLMYDEAIVISRASGMRLYW